MSLEAYPKNKKQEVANENQIIKSTLLHFSFSFFLNVFLLAFFGCFLKKMTNIFIFGISMYR